MKYNLAKQTMGKTENKNLQGRRDFFKQAANKTLPLLGIMTLISNPIIAHTIKKVPTNCSGSSCSSTCRTTCETMCGKSCTGYCRSGCDNSCAGSCKEGCAVGCKGGCHGTCSTSCKGSNK